MRGNAVSDASCGDPQDRRSGRASMCASSNGSRRSTATSRPGAHESRLFKAWHPIDDYNCYTFYIHFDPDRPIDVEAIYSNWGHRTSPPDYKTPHTLANMHLQDRERMERGNFSGVTGAAIQDRAVQEEHGADLRPDPGASRHQRQGGDLLSSAAAAEAARRWTKASRCRRTIRRCHSTSAPARAKCRPTSHGKTSSNGRRSSSRSRPSRRNSCRAGSTASGCAAMEDILATDRSAHRPGAERARKICVRETDWLVSRAYRALSGRAQLNAVREVAPRCARSRAKAPTKSWPPAQPRAVPRHSGAGEGQHPRQPA